MFPVDEMEAMIEMTSMMSSISVLWNLLYYGGAIALYVLGALGLYTIAKRREISHAWMAWVPVLNVWILGSIADQYMYVVKSKVTNFRKWMVALSAAMVVAVIVIYVMIFVAVFTLAMEAGFGGNLSEAQAIDLVMNTFLPVFAILGLYILVALVQTVLQYVSYYHLFASCDPENKTLFLVLSLFFSFLISIFTFVCRKKDFGMPPRTDAQPAAIPQAAYVPPTAYAPQATYAPQAAQTDAASVASAPQAAPDAPTPPVPSAIMSWGDPIAWAEASAQAQQPTAQPEQPPVQPEPPAEITGNTQ